MATGAKPPDSEGSPANLGDLLLDPHHRPSFHTVWVSLTRHLQGDTVAVEILDIVAQSGT